MTSQLADEINALKQVLLIMAGHSGTTVRSAMRALVERNDDLARSVITNDAAIDECEVEVDKRVLALLAKAMLATDLRLVTIAMKLSQNLERIGDEATTIARRTLLLNTDPKNELLVDLPAMAILALGMLDDALISFSQNHPENARAIIARDKEVDALNRKFHQSLIGQMTGHLDQVNTCLHLMVISRCLEHVADHAASIAEEVVYLYEAQDIRHPGLAQAQPPVA